jgi:thiosulfate reductase cytochrome b subunit
MERTNLLLTTSEERLAMASMSIAPVQRQKKIQPLIVRITHWINAVAMFIMIGSGWRIFNDSPLFPFIFHPDITLGGDVQLSFEKWQDSGMGGALQWHFAGMWLLVLNGLVYFAYNFATGRFRMKLLPVTLTGLLGDIGDALRFKLAHDDLSVYNHVQKLLYIGVLILGVLVVLSGLAIWKPVQLWWLTDLFYGFQGARWVHFFCMTGFVLFLIVHVALAVLVPRTIVSMITGNAPPAHAPKERE